MSLEIGGGKRGAGAGGSGADETGGAGEMGIDHVGIGQGAFGGVVPLGTLIERGIGEADAEEGYGAGVELWADDGDVERGAAKLVVGQKDPPYRDALLKGDGGGCQISHGAAGEGVVGFSS